MDGNPGPPLVGALPFCCVVPHPHCASWGTTAAPKGVSLVSAWVSSPLGPIVPGARPSCHHPWGRPGPSLCFVGTRTRSTTEATRASSDVFASVPVLPERTHQHGCLCVAPGCPGHVAHRAPKGALPLRWRGARWAWTEASRWRVLWDWSPKQRTVTHPHGQGRVYRPRWH